MSLMPEKASVRPAGGERMLPSEGYVAKALPQVLSTHDLTATFVVAIFWMVNATTAATGGAVAFVYWLLGGLAFFLPCVLASAQLGVLFPRDGSLYTWTHKALGRYWGFFVGVCFWFPGPLALVIAASAFVTYLQGLHSAWLTSPWQQGLVMVLFMLFVGVLSCQRTRMVQYVVNMLCGLTLFALALIALAGLVWLLRGHPSATSFVQASDWIPTPGNYGLFGLITLGYLGTQVSLNMSGEIAARPPRTAITRHLVWGSLIVVGGYLVTTFALLVVRGPALLTAPVLNFELVTTVDTVLGKVAGNLVAVCLLAFFVAAAVVYNTSSARLLLVASIDQRLPTSMGKLTRSRVPANAIILQTLLAILFTAMVFLGVPAITSLGTPADLTTEVYNVSLASLTLVWVLASVFLFVDLLWVMLRDPLGFARQRVVPRWMLWASLVIGPVTCGVVFIDTLLNSWIPQIDNAHWWYLVGGLTAVCVFFVALGSLLASGEAAWQRLREEEDSMPPPARQEQVVPVHTQQRK